MADILENLCPAECPAKLLCVESQVETLLSNLNVNKSSGPDAVSPRMLKPTSTSVSPVQGLLVQVPFKHSGKKQE